MSTQAESAPWSDLPERFPTPKRTLPTLLRRQADEYGDRTLAVFGSRSLDFAAAPDLAARAAAGLRSVGVERGDRVALMCSNRFEFLEVFLGAAWLGAVTVPLNTASRGDQLRHMLTNSGARVLIAEPELLDRVTALEEPGRSIRTVLLTRNAEHADHQYARWTPSETPVPAVESGPGDPVAILYTSGTTGVSKGVRCPHAQYFWWGFHGVQILEIRSGDVLLTTLPLFHTNAIGALHHALLTGSTLVVEQRFSASGFVNSLRRHGATVTYLLGAMVPILLSRPATAEDFAHHTRVALAPGVPAEAGARFTKRFGIGLVDGFGSTESNFVIAAPLHDQRPGTMGRLRPGFHARVVDEHDEDVPTGQPGELVLRADEPYAFATGYHGMPAETLDTWRNLWLHAGDRVSRDEDGYFRFIDRMKDSIRRRGENISSYEVEQVLADHPAVAQVAVYPVRSELAEDEVMAAVVPREPGRVTPSELLDHCQSRLSYFALPRYIDLVDDLPMTPNGKVQKFRLREAGVTATTWDREAHGYRIRR